MTRYIEELIMANEKKISIDDLIAKCNAGIESAKEGIADLEDSRRKIGLIFDTIRDQMLEVNHLGHQVAQKIAVKAIKVALNG